MAIEQLPESGHIQTQFPPIDGEDKAQLNPPENHLIKPQEITVFAGTESILSKILREASGDSLVEHDQPYPFMIHPRPDQDIAYPPDFRKGKIWGN